MKIVFKKVFSENFTKNGQFDELNGHIDLKVERIPRTLYVDVLISKYEKQQSVRKQPFTKEL
ncbi:hypothetical protein [Bacillus sp. SM2101]|uniref:hypothetical protein n=1 Tax=Bacillus sp. SM2101 TaxID=2805366 RepID=UPI001BDEFB2B|nr:hypothetical protein [Bacillus sp. SM2101]